MTPDEATKTLAALTAAWPTADLPEPTIRLWLGLLADIDLDDAMNATRQLVRTEHFFPSLARFLNETAAQEHARRNRHAARYGLPAGHKPAPPPPRLVEASRRLLAEIGEKRHDHHGPQPCPICGGVRPDIPKKERT